MNPLFGDAKANKCQNSHGGSIELSQELGISMCFCTIMTLIWGCVYIQPWFCKLCKHIPSFGSITIRWG